MYAVKVLFSFRKSLPEVVKTSLLKQIRHKFDKTKHTSFDFRAQVKNDEVKKGEIKGDKFWTNVLNTERKYSNALSILAIFYAWTVLLGTVFYSFRSVRKIILNKGGRELTIVTYSLPNFNTITVPLSSVRSTLPRVKAKKYIPMKLKNKYFYYLVDVKGEFSNPTLFDYTAGINRNF